MANQASELKQCRKTGFNDAAIFYEKRIPVASFDPPPSPSINSIIWKPDFLQLLRDREPDRNLIDSALFVCSGHGFSSVERHVSFVFRSLATASVDLYIFLRGQTKPVHEKRKRRRRHRRCPCLWRFRFRVTMSSGLHIGYDNVKNSSLDIFVNIVKSLFKRICQNSRGCLQNGRRISYLIWPSLQLRSCVTCVRRSVHTYSHKSINIHEKIVTRRILKY